MAGLSARQQNDWDNRGMLPHKRQGEEGWRRYTAREIFVLMVCAEIRRRYGTPVERLRWVQQFMLAEGANHLEAAMELIVTLGVGVWLCTDLEETFAMDSELEFVDMWRSGYFGAEREKAFVFVPVNGIVNRMLSHLEKPIELPPHGRGYEIMRMLDGIHRARSPEEVLVLDLIRREDIDTVEVISPSGHVETIRSTAKHDPAASIEQLLDQPYQQLTIVTRGGKTVHIEQEITIKPDKAAG